MFEKIKEVIDFVKIDTISSERKEELQLLIDYIQLKKDNNEAVKLNFICTHNSRRSQLSQIWAKVAAEINGVKVESYSGGVEVTAFNQRAMDSLKRLGFIIEHVDSENPRYLVSYQKEALPMVCFSKLFDDVENPKGSFAAIMTCSHADENCPYVPGCEKRIPVRYDDPKEYDDSPLETCMYDYRSFEIATEMMYVFSTIKK